MSKVAKIALGVVAGFVVLACAGGALGAYLLKKDVVDKTLSAADYAAIPDGDSKAHVRSLTGGSGTLARKAVEDVEPEVPAGAACDYSWTEKTQDVYRFCFTGDKLVEKTLITVPDSSK